MMDPFYQVSTIFPLFRSKVLCKTEEQIFKHLDQIIKKTEQQRSKADPEWLEKKKIALQVSDIELEHFTVILKVDPKVEPRVLNFLGTTM